MVEKQLEFPFMNEAKADDIAEAMSTLEDNVQELTHCTACCMDDAGQLRRNEVLSSLKLMVSISRAVIDSMH